MLIVRIMSTAGCSVSRPVLRMRLDMEVDALPLEDRHQLFHRAPPGVLAGLDHGAGLAAIAGCPCRGEGRGRTRNSSCRRPSRPRSRWRVFQWRTAARRSSSSLDGPAIHRQQRGDASTSASLERLLEDRDALGKTRGALNHSRKSPRGREFDPLVAELGDLRGQRLERQMPVHVRVKGDLHGSAPRLDVAVSTVRTGGGRRSRWRAGGGACVEFPVRIITLFRGGRKNRCELGVLSIFTPALVPLAAKVSLWGRD